MRIYSNDDEGVILLKLRDLGEYTEENIRSYPRIYKSTPLTDLLVNVNAQYSIYPSKVWETAAERYLLTEVDGIKVDPKGTVLENAHLMEEAGLDYFSILFDECYKVGIRPWLSFRMNDMHGNGRVSKTGYPSQSEYTHRARQNGLVRASYRENAGYYDDALNYLLSEVRAHFLDYIREQINTYSVSGIELDFSREFLCFPVGLEEEGRRVMLDFFREVREITEAASKLHGRKIEVMVRAMSRPLDDFRSGLDVINAARAGYIDVVVPTAHFSTTDDSCPVEMWKRALPENVRLAVGTEINTMPTPSKGRCPRPDEMFHGLSHNFLSLGADDIYLFNELYAHDIEEGSFDKLLSPLADRKTLKETNRIIPVSYANITAPGEPQPHRLPMRLLERFWGASEYRDLRFYVGDNEGEPLYLFFAINAEPDRLSLYVNGVEPTYLGKCELPQYTENHVLVYSIPPMSGNERALEIRALDRDGSVDPFIDYAEMRNYLSIDLTK